MVAIDKLAGDRIRKIIEFEDSEGEVQVIEITNPSKKVKEKIFNEKLDEEWSDDYKILEYLIQELTNVELTKPLKEIDLEEDYVNLAYYEMIKEISSIVIELVREFVLIVDVDMGMEEAKRILEEKNR